MLRPLSAIAALFVLFEIGDCGTSNDNELELVFRDRSQSDWQKVWHQEKHSRCRDKLITHLYWACEKDIYRLTRRSNTPPEDHSNYDNYPWISRHDARTILRVKRDVNRRGRSSITLECCSFSGCTWEEYAEYCPSNKRFHSL